MIAPKLSDAAFLLYLQMTDVAQKIADIVREKLQKVPGFYKTLGESSTQGLHQGLLRGG